MPLYYIIRAVPIFPMPTLSPPCSQALVQSVPSFLTLNMVGAVMVGVCSALLQPFATHQGVQCKNLSNIPRKIFWFIGLRYMNAHDY
jgi:hypothetical protein